MIYSKEKLDECIKDYQELCKIFGNILDAPSKGGNISIKNDEYFIIKASGEDLKKEHKISIFKNNINSLSYCKDYCEDIVKPSMEIKMHIVFKNKYVAHYHPVYILPYLCAKEYKFKNYKAIDFALPGNDLYEALRKNYSYQEKGIILLRNHGVVVYAEQIQDIIELYNQLKSEFFEQNDFVYTPDDAVDKTNEELWLFRNVMENIAIKKQINLNPLKVSEVDKLLNLPDEQYRKKIMESES
ncbi:TPA: class II aldolase/adducin family protein [Campylobacter jejuni]|uniref:class II aldolase/adducin family protein n=1 Tax=Campylobacter jejuni TaxID=197 RepID=UPI0001C265AB|nr:class II aldolase/adducin family protein [Campylobacter jejuni]EHU8417002.1 class II aldolase/adducin family protein [Campylobacter coli]EAH4585633.1 class II aldolase/adducin family protein [Campylobacter jejuni]EAH4637172.1 class II aldolase/adducin family protein [Campylobacter jejuni]EAH4843491.1 class II aldolase/adducin family protein [Campylobacter jejuni]EAH5004283.1 class II aldolase/adducin family protein [Campylobacter jejuni]